MRPFLRWAGGKRWLAGTDRLNLPSTTRYVEPFLGGGAMFFSRAAGTALLSDLNPFLINAFRWMKEAPDGLFCRTQAHFLHHSIEHYYAVREALECETLDGAAAFIYLNRSCFNGLFRVNLDGRFNVPIGTKLFAIADVSEFHGWSKHLVCAKLVQGDFEEVIAECSEGDFIFVDPPYTVKHNANGFIEYNEKIFSWDDQVRLSNCLRAAKERGASFLLTNADHESVRSLYSDEAWTTAVRGSEMASRSVHRSSITELLVASSAEMLRAPSLL